MLCCGMVYCVVICITRKEYATISSFYRTISKTDISVRQRPIRRLIHHGIMEALSLNTFTDR